MKYLIRRKKPAGNRYRLKDGWWTRDLSHEDILYYRKLDIRRFFHILYIRYVEKEDVEFHKLLDGWSFRMDMFIGGD